METWYILNGSGPKKPRGYGLSNFVGDLTLTFMTCGLWAIWWIIREINR